MHAEYLYFNRFGPLINYWTTRFEAKHKYFKHLANVIGNFTNICYSLSLRHQFRQCYLSLNSDGVDDVEVSPGMLHFMMISHSFNHIFIGTIVECPSSLLWKSTSTLKAAILFRYALVHTCVICTTAKVITVTVSSMHGYYTYHPPLH